MASSSGSGISGADGGERALAQHPGRLTVLVPVEETIVGIGGVASDSGQPQSRRVGDADVMAHADQQHRVIGRNDVEIGTGRMPPLGETRVVVAATEIHSPAGRDATASRTRCLQGGDGRVALRGEIEIEQRKADRHRVSVGVVQSRGCGPPRQIDGWRPRRRGRFGAGIISGVDDPTTADRNRGDLRVGRSIVRMRPLTRSRSCGHRHLRWVIRVSG